MKWLICVIFICGILNEVKAQSYDKFLDRLLDYQKHVRVKDSLINGKYIASIDTNTFDLKDYMSIFSKLTPDRDTLLSIFMMQVGMVLFRYCMHGEKT